MVKKMVVGIMGVAVMSLVLVTNLYADGKGCCKGNRGHGGREHKFKGNGESHKPKQIPPGQMKEAGQDCDKSGDWKARGFDKEKMKDKFDHKKDWKQHDRDDNSGKGVGDKKNQGMCNGNKGNGNTTHGNNGVGNGIDPQPPGNPPINDGSGTGPGNPGNRGGANSNSSSNSNNGNHNGR